MAAAQQAGQPQPQPRPAQQTKPNSVMALLKQQTTEPPNHKPPDHQANTDLQTFGTCPPHTICGATPCPHCASTWIIETYGPTGRTLCHGCRTQRSPLGLFDYDEPALTAAATAGQRSITANAATLTITQFIDAVIAAGYPQLAEIARKYQQQPMASQPTAHQPTANQLANQPGQTK